MGISHRRLNGWEPKQHISYVRTGSRITDRVVTTEPEFDDEQRDLLLASAEYEASLNRNGFPWSEATNPAANPNEYAGGYHYVPDILQTDWSEKTRLDFIDAYRKEHGEKANMNGLIVGVRRVDDPPFNPLDLL